MAKSESGQEATITVDGVSYPVAGLSKEARNAVGNLRAAEAELRRLQVQVGMARVARQVFGQQLKAALKAK